MIGVITSATQSGCVLGYDLGDKKNKDQRIKILDFEGVWIDMRDVEKLNKNWTDATSKKEFKKLSRAVADDLSKQFDGQAEINENVKKTTGHIALSFSPLDRGKLTHALKLKIAREYMERMGIVDTQWVLTEHYDTNAPHMHIAYNRVKFDGMVIDSKSDRYRSQRISRELSEKYGLTPAGKAERKRSSLHPEQQVYAQLREQALEALKYSLSFSEFEDELSARGIVLQKARHSDGKIYGLSYSIFDGAFAAKGSKLDRGKLSLKSVMSSIEKNKQRFAESCNDLPSEIKSTPTLTQQNHIPKPTPQPVPQPRVKTVQELAKLKNVKPGGQESTKEAINKAELLDNDENKKTGIKI